MSEMKITTTVKYYPIDEDLARRAHDMMSMRDYPANRATEEYRAAVDKAAALVERQKARVSPFYHGKLDALLDRYARFLAQWTNDYNRNGASCPSILVSGGSNFPVRKKQKQNARKDVLMQRYREIEGILHKIGTVGTGAVDLADPNAKEILSGEVQRLQKGLDEGKAMNAWYRKHKTMKGYPGMDDGTAAKYDARIQDSYSWAQKPMPDYVLTSLRNKIKRAKARLGELEKLKNGAVEPGWTFEGGEVVVNTELNRVQILFDGKPEADVRGELKSHGFRWAPSLGAWQRQLTENAMQAAREVTGRA